MKRAVTFLLVATLASACGQRGATSAPPSASSVGPWPSASSPSPSATPSQSPTSSDGPVTLSFERVADVHGTAELVAIAAFDGGYVAGGCRLRPPPGDGSEGGCAGAISLVSRDGRSWSEVAVPDASERTIVGLSATPLGVLAFGSTQHSEPPQARSVWRLAGDRWEPFPIPAPALIVFRTASLVNGRIVFLGSDTTYDFALETEAWSTIDGTSWSNGSTPISAKVAAEPGLVAMGNECFDVCGPESRTHVYRSTDGFTWTEEPLPVELASTAVSSLAVREGRVIIGGGTADGAAVATLWLDESTGWRQVVLPDGGGMTVSSLLVSVRGIIAIGRSMTDDAEVAWWSPDGLAWSPARLEGIGQGYVAASAGGNPLVVIVNYDSIWASES